MSKHASPFFLFVRARPPSFSSAVRRAGPWSVCGDDDQRQLHLRAADLRKIPLRCGRVRNPSLSPRPSSGTLSQQQKPTPPAAPVVRADARIRVSAGESLRYYFTVNQRFVIKRLQMLWCPFLFKGHWNRSHEQVVGGSAYRPPTLDMYAPDLYLPVMGFCSYCMLCCVSDLFHKGVFAPEVRFFLSPSFPSPLLLPSVAPSVVRSLSIASSSAATSAAVRNAWQNAFGCSQGDERSDKFWAQCMLCSSSEGWQAAQRYCCLSAPRLLFLLVPHRLPSDATAHPPTHARPTRSPQRAGRYVWWASLAWLALVGVMWGAVQSVAGSQGVSFLDVSANAGYIFILVSGECALGFFSRNVYYAMYAWGTIGYFLYLVKTLRRDLAGSTRMGGGASKKKAAVLLVALSQAPIAFWLGRLPRS